MRNILLYLSIKFKGEWNSIFHFISKKNKVDDLEVERLSKEYKGNKFITILDPEYPEYLKNIYNPPFVLFYKGDISLLNSERRISVVGSRDNSTYGEKACNKLVGELCDYGYTIVSGLARGIDGIAFKEALKKEGKTIGVVAHGLDIIYPKSNAQLYDEVLSNGGLIISEFPDNIEPTQDKFNTRNRIVAAIGQKVLVIEAHEKSGTMLTVNHALAQGKNIYCVPDNIFMSSWCNKLIKEGATLVEGIDDIQ